ncbi:hypothetical protein [Bacillus dakarensis]|uniref:hypothetical protein n=1 Tax=Robertmurraya dakarensis TaxID=1926278 RepID=UPI00098091C1|nr:hypothetical protein [Bacillus dakarensis]
MDDNSNLIQSINNVRNLIHNSILILRDLDTLLSKYSFQPLNGNALGSESSKSLYQSMTGYRTFLPQYMARQYALENDIEERKVKKILFTNIQLFHGYYDEIPPVLINSIISLPNHPKNLKNDIQNWWLKNTVYEDVKWENVKKHGELNEHVDDEGYKTIFWCNDLLSFQGQKELSNEVEKSVQIYNRTNDQQV